MNDGGAKKDDIEEADDKKKPVEQIQPQKDNRENEEEGKNDLDMEDLTKEKGDESNLMVKLKIDGQGVYLKKVGYQAYQEGMETGIGENIPNPEMKEEVEIKKEIIAEPHMMKPLEQKSML